MKKKGNPIALRFIILGIVLLVILLSAFLIFREGSLPVNAKNTTSKIFTIEPGEAIDKIIRRLESDGLIRNRLVFYTVIKQKGIDIKIQAGKFRLSPSMDAYALAEELTHGTDDTWITVIEGLRKEEIAEEIKDKLGIPVIELASIGKEGYLFPDTYLFPSSTSAEEVIKAFNANYKTKVTPEIIASAQELGLTEPELIILASLVEREARSEEARRNVASIMLKRLQEDMPLQIDATVQYAHGYNTNEKTYWKKNLTFDDLEIDSPYNTYKNQGLPPGPICSPSLSSIIAVSEANPSTPYLFYITGNDNKMHYGRNLDEHNANIKRYLD
jgi:UPF0755 protein